MKKAIITGSTGFIGSAFVEFLVAKGIDVLAIGRKDLNDISKIRRKRIKDATYLNLDMKNISQLSEKISEIKWSIGDDCVFFNLAWGGETNLSDLNIQSQMLNVAWCVNALEVSEKIGCSRFIQVGTMEEAFTHKYLKLDHHKNDQYNRHVIYSVAKIAAKYALKLKASNMNIDYIYVLHSHVMGEDDDKDSFLQVTLQKLVNGDDLIFSSGEQFFDVISLADCSLGYYLICQKGKSDEEYWVGSGNPRKLREYVEKMFNLFPSKKEMQFGKLPYNDIILEKEDFSIANLEADTGYKPIMTFEETVKELHESLFGDSDANK
ncbi:MAG: NAD(P)-dependent oxidoreductase [Gammaproteobacteria bacterium]